MLDEIAEAVLARNDIISFLRGTTGETEAQTRERVCAYLKELRTTQRLPLYRALQHPLYPILRKIDRQHEHLDRVTAIVDSHRLVYTSNHKSHTDYLVEPLVLDDNGIRPPRIAAGVNLFGGVLGSIHRHITGAVPIRRNTKDAA
jgi:glycerol-3-phosphate O-acyltransferase